MIFYAVYGLIYDACLYRTKYQSNRIFFINLTIFQVHRMDIERIFFRSYVFSAMLQIVSEIRLKLEIAMYIRDHLC